MGMRLGGIVSGMDTEGIIKELMSARSVKKTKLQGSKTKLEWKQEKWADLNTKLYKLWTDYASNLRLQKGYDTKKTSVANEGVASVKAATNAANGSYTLDVMQLATSQYVTGGKIDGVASGNVKSSTKLSDIDSNLIGNEITITNGSKSVSIQVKADTKVSDLVNTMNKAGLNANFDEKQQRFFISSKESGASNRFSITTNKLSSGVGGEIEARQSLENALRYNSLSAADKAIVDQSYAALRNGMQGTEKYGKAVESLEKIAAKNAENDVNAAATNYVRALLAKDVFGEEETMANFEEKARALYYEQDEEGNSTIKADARSNAIRSIKDDIREELIEQGISDEDMDEEVENVYQARIGAAPGREDELIENRINQLVTENVDMQVAAEVSKRLKSNDAKAQINALKETGLTREAIEASGLGLSSEEIEEYTFLGLEDAQQAAKEDLAGFITSYNGVVNGLTPNSSALNRLGLSDLDGTIDIGSEGGVSDPSGMTVVSARDSKIKLNNAELTSSSTTVVVNGLTIDLKDEGRTTFSVAKDTDATYNMIKDFINEYNTIMKEMNTLLRAKSARGYEPLTDDEKEAMTEKQIELWENKIKDSLFRNDDKLSSITSSMRNAMMSSVEVNGKKYSLSSLGIMTSSDYTENGLLHIFGNADDPTYADETNKLMKMLTEDPELVTSIMKGISEKLYSTMYDKMKSSTLSSALTFYNDKQMNKQKTSYEEQIKTMEKRLNEIENRYYKQFTAMEKAMSKLNSQSNYFSNLMGGQ